MNQRFSVCCRAGRPTALVIGFLFLLMLVPSLAPAATGAGLWLDKSSYAPGEQMVVHFVASADFAANAWVGIIPSEIPHGSEATNDQHDLTFQHLNKQSSGDLIFQAPSAPGNYDLRMNDSDDDGKEVASVSFTVGGGRTSPEPGPAGGSGSLRLDRKRFSPGENATVHFTASPAFADNAWVGILPSEIPHGSEATNDQHDLTFQHLNKRSSGDLVFQVPTAPGAYDFRMNDNDDNGKEVASVSFRVGGGGAGSATGGGPRGKGNLRLDKSSFAPGETITVHFTASPAWPGNAWIGIIPSSVPHGSEATNDQNDLTFQHLQNRGSGELTFQAPANPGSYDFRMNDNDTNGNEVGSVSFTVGAGGGTLRLDETAFAPGEQIVVHFTASAAWADNAWVGIIPSEIPHGSEATNDQHDLTFQHLNKRSSGDLIFQAPTTPGAYDFRMNDNDNNGQEAASVSFTVGQ